MFFTEREIAVKVFWKTEKGFYEKPFRVSKKTFKLLVVAGRVDHGLYNKRI
jgi:hypothetical protein